MSTSAVWGIPVRGVHNMAAFKSWKAGHMCLLSTRPDACARYPRRKGLTWVTVIKLAHYKWLGARSMPATTQTYAGSNAGWVLTAPVKP